jgi:DNA-binding CsgD family transcriptional regulator
MLLAADSSRSSGPLQSSRPSRQLEYVARHMHDERGRVIQLRRAFHRCQVPMLLVDNTRRYLDANRGARLLFRLTLGELRQRQIDDLTPRAGLDRMKSLWNELLDRGELWGDYDVRFDDGSQIHVVFSALANVLPGQHLIVFAPASWPEDELGPMEERTVRPRPRPLSAREREILTLIADGLSLAEIAERLTISLATVRTHTANAYRKLGARNRPHAVALALRLGLIEPADARMGDPWAPA